MLPYNTEDKDSESMQTNLNWNSSSNHIAQEKNGNPLQIFEGAAQRYTLYQTDPKVQVAWNALVMSVDDPLNYPYDINDFFKYYTLDSIIAKHKEEDLLSQFHKICDEAESKRDTCNIDTSAAYQVDGIFTPQRLLQSNTKTHPTKQKKKATRRVKGLTDLEIIYHHYRHLPHVEAAWQKQHHDSPQGVTLLHHATREGNLYLMSILIDTGFKIDSRDTNGATSLHYAIGQGNPDIIEYLIERGADLNVLNHRGQTPLRSAVHRNNSDAITLLAKGGADLNKQDKQGLTPLHYAAKQNRSRAIKALLKAGAAPLLKDHQGKTPIDYVVPSLRQNFIKAIEEQAHNKNSNLDTNFAEATHAQVTSTPYGTAQSTIFDDNRKRRHLTGKLDEHNITTEAPRWSAPS